MTVDFTSSELQHTYNDRCVDQDWLRWCETHLQPQNKVVIDLGCGGGIYTRGFAALGAQAVIGIDSAAQYVDEAAKSSQSLSNVNFKIGTATHTGLGGESSDIVFHRAVIHHLNQDVQAAGAREIFRVLKSGGLCVVQDRTFKDVESTQPRYWIRSTLFESFPRLLENERARRPTAEGYCAQLKSAGFTDIELLNYAETRQVYSSVEELLEQILARKGKSILFELSDDELRAYCTALADKCPAPPIIEMDSWTVWLATKST